MRAHDGPHAAHVAVGIAAVLAMQAPFANEQYLNHEKVPLTMEYLSLSRMEKRSASSGVLVHSRIFLAQYLQRAEDGHAKRRR